MTRPADETRDPPMTDPQADETDWETRRRLAEIFGDVLPSTTRDERDPDAASGRGESGGDAWLRRQVPPHHGG